MKLHLKIFFSVLFFIVLFPVHQVSAQTEEKHEAVINQILEDKQTEVAGTAQPSQRVEAEMTEGEMKGKKITTQDQAMATDNQKLKIGDKIVVSHIKGIDGSDQFYISDFVRRNSLYVLAAAFLLAVVLVGGIRGLSSFIGLIISFIVLLKYIIPQIASGANPVFVAISGSFVILIFTLYLAHGISRRTTAAVFGTFFSLAFTAILASAFVGFAKLSGISSEEASYLSLFPTMQINIKGILLGGMIIGALGVLDDITISQAASVFELKDANNKLSFRELYARGLRIGREHIASLVNTLVLAYAGASLPLLLLFSLNGGEPFKILLNREMIATEIVRTFVGSLGLVSAVPVTTAIAAGFAKSKG